MKLNIKKLSIKQLVSIGSLVSLGGLALSVSFNQDMRTIIQERARQLTTPLTVHDTIFEPAPAPAPDTVTRWVSDPELLPVLEGAFEEAVHEMKLEFLELTKEVDDVDLAIAAIDSSHEELVDQVRELAAREIPKPMIYVVVDSVFVAVDPDTLQDAEEWLRLLWPWYKMEGVNR